MGDISFAFAFAAGLVATLNPCGFAMLPAYLSYFMGAEEDTPVSGSATVARGLTTGAVVSAGFLVVFGVAGTLVTVGFRSVIDYVPWVALVIGIALAALGAAMLFLGFELNVTLPHLERGGTSRRYRSMFLFGISYAVASLSCALPVFLAVVGVAQATPTFLAGLVTFIVYGLGMSMLLVVLTLALALTKTLVHHMRSVLPYISRASGAVLLISGVYITFYWAANIGDPLAARGTTFRSVETLQTWIADQLSTRPTFWALVLGAVITAATAYALRSRRRPTASTPGADVTVKIESAAESIPRPTP